MQDKKVQGNIDGIRNSVLAELSALYDVRLEPDCYAPREMIECISRISGQLNREVSVYISRDGEVLDVSVGGPESVQLKSIRMRRNPDRLSCVRCLHTHPEGEARLSGVDRQALRSLKFDSMAAIAVHDSQATRIAAAFLGEMDETGMVQLVETPAYALRDLPQQMWMHEILLADARVRAYSGEERRQQQAMLVSLDNERSLDELAALADTAGLVVIDRVMQKLPHPENATYIGSGKVEELALTMQALNIDVAIFDDELTGIQIRNLEDKLGVKVVDRTGLILEIFAQRAASREGKLQVELAQLQYRLPRLMGLGNVLSRLGGGASGGLHSRGAGETQLEQDRRVIRDRISSVRDELNELRKQRDVQRKQRKKTGIPVVALVGYTNAGKSTLLNALSGADAFVEDRLFATLDTTTRKLQLPDNQECLIVDTVGFINKLPHDLVDAFKATLEEAVLADMLVIVSDASSPVYEHQRDVVRQVLEQLGAGGKPTIEALNKCDALPNPPITGANQVAISASSGAGLDELIAMIQRKAAAMLHRVEVLVPYDKGQYLSLIHDKGTVISEEYQGGGTLVTALLDAIIIEKLSRAIGPDSIRTQSAQ